MGVRLANLRLRPTLIDQIIQEQKESVEGKQVIEAIHSGKKKDLRLDEGGCNRYEDRLWVSPASELKKEILREVHSSPHSIHPGSTKMYKDLKKYYWQENMKRDVADFVANCITCQQINAEHRKPSGELQPLPVLMWKWEEITMDFVRALPQTQSGNETIQVIIDRLTKSAHFIPLRIGYTIEKLAKIYMQEIVRLHGVPLSIVFDRDPHFVSRFQKSLH